MSTRGVGGGAHLKQTCIVTWVLQAFILCLIDDIVCFYKFTTDIGYYAGPLKGIVLRCSPPEVGFSPSMLA